MTQTTAEPASRLDRGDHVCAFYRGRAERDELLVPFLADGLEAGHRCLAVVDSGTPEELVAAVGAAEGLSVLASGGVYLPGGAFDMDTMLDFYAAALDDVAKESADGCIRTAGEMSWATYDVPGAADLLAYEARVNQVLATRPSAAISMCLYDVERFDGEIVVGVLRTHPKAVLAGTVVDNPFYIRPEDFIERRVG
jgi:hypothetical protein